MQMFIYIYIYILALESTSAERAARRSIIYTIHIFASLPYL